MHGSLVISTASTPTREFWSPGHCGKKPSAPSSVCVWNEVKRIPMRITRVSQLLFTAALVFAGKLSAQNAVTIRVGHFPNVTHVQALVAHALSRQGKGWFEERLGGGPEIAWRLFNARPGGEGTTFAK